MKTISKIYIAAILIFASCILPGAYLFAQTLSPHVFGTGGGYVTNGGVSLSFTIGETFNTTLQGGNLVLTQGEQQPDIKIPIAVANPSQQTICSGTAITTIALTGNVKGTIFNWKRDNVAAITGIAASGAGDISGVLTNTTNAAVTVTFTITPTANNYSGPPITATILVNPVPLTPAIIPGGPTTFCAGGSVTLTSSAAPGNQWYLDGTPIAGATAQDYSATAAGEYTLTVVANGCTSIASPGVTITVNPISSTPAITTGGSTTFCSGSSVSLTSTSASGNQWYQDGSPIVGATAQDYSATAAALYTVIVTMNGCASTASPGVVTTVNPIPPTPVINPAGPTIFCSGGSVSLSSSAASGNQWYQDGNPIAGATAQDYSATAAGEYTLSVMANGCTSTASPGITLTVNPIPSTPGIIAGGSTTFCSGSSVSLTSSSTSGNQWYQDGSPIDGATAQVYPATAAALYTVIITMNGCASTASPGVTTTVNPIPPTPGITTVGSTSFCSGGSVSLTSSSASGNQWYLNGSPIVGATAQSYSALTPGLYTVSVTTNGCTSTASAGVAVTVNPIPNAVATPSSQTVCSGTASSIGLTSSVTGATFSWTVVQSGISGASAGNGNSIVQTLTATGTAAGKATYTITPSVSGCQGTAIAATVTVNSAPTVNLSAGTITCNGGLTTITVNAGGGTGPYKYKLSGGLSFQVLNTFIVGAGTYTVTVQGANGCTKTTSPITISQPPAITENLSVGTIGCYGGTSTITVSAAGGTPSYTYALDNGSYKNGNSFTAAAGTHTLYIKDSKGCTASKSIAITQPSALSVSISAAAILCNGGTSAVTVSAAGGTSPYTGTGTFTKTTGSYTFTVTDSKGCAGSKTITITQPAVLSVSLNSKANVSCNGGNTGSITVTAKGGTTPYTYKLNTAASYQSSSTFGSLTAGTYSVTVKDKNGCSVAISGISLAQPATALALTLVQKVDVSCLNGSNGSIKVSASGGTSPYKYSLNNDSYGTSGTFSSLHAGTYTVNTKDANNCTKSITVVINNGTRHCNTLSITDAKASDAQIDDGTWLKAEVTPNPTETEFTLTISGKSDKPVEIRVVDMYGKSVYYARGSANQSYKFGQRFASGVYIVEILQGKNVKNLKIIKAK